MSALTTINICDSHVDYLPLNLFILRLQSNEMINICLNNNHHLNGSSFEINSLINIKRPAQIYLQFSNLYKLNFLDQKVFHLFLYANENNKLILTNRPIDCNDCRLYWIKMYSKIVEKIVNLKCDNGIEFSDNLIS